MIHYGRYSSRGQKDGTSEERQIDKVDRWAESAGIAFTDRMIDRAASGFHGAHRKAGDFGSLLEQAKAGAIPTPALVVLAEGDRAGREDVDVQLESLVLGLLRGGVDIYVVDSGLHLNLEKWRADLGAQIQLQAILHGANQYSRRLSERMRDAHKRGREKVSRGEVTRPGWAPSWIDLKDGEWVFNSYAGTIRRLLELVADHGYNATAARLTEEGHRPPRSKKWTQGNVASLVKSEAVAGGRITLRRDPESVVWDYYPALMSRLEWQALLARIASRDGASTHGGNQSNINFIGQGLCVCQQCGRAVGGRVSSYRRRDGTRIQRRYVRCRGRQEKICDSPALLLDDVTAHLLSRLSLPILAQLFPQQRKSELSDLQSKVQVLQQRVEQQQTAVSNGQQQIAALLTSAPETVPFVAQAVADAKRLLETLEQELHQVRTQINSLKSDARRQLGKEVSTKAAKLLQLFAREEDGPDDRRQLNTLMRRLGLRITVDSKARQIGMAIGGEGEMDWQPLAPAARGRALELGVVAPSVARDLPGGGYDVLDWDQGLPILSSPTPSPQTQTPWSPAGCGGGGMRRGSRSCRSSTRQCGSTHTGEQSCPIRYWSRPAAPVDSVCAGSSGHWRRH